MVYIYYIYIPFRDNPHEGDEDCSRAIFSIERYLGSVSVTTRTGPSTRHEVTLARTTTTPPARKQQHNLISDHTISYLRQIMIYIYIYTDTSSSSSSSPAVMICCVGSVTVQIPTQENMCYRRSCRLYGSHPAT